MKNLFCCANNDSHLYYDQFPQDFYYANIQPPNYYEPYPHNSTLYASTATTIAYPPNYNVVQPVYAGYPLAQGYPYYQNNH